MVRAGQRKGGNKMFTCCCFGPLGVMVIVIEYGACRAREMRQQNVYGLVACAAGGDGRIGVLYCCIGVPVYWCSGVLVY